jgi:mxaL protein
VSSRNLWVVAVATLLLAVAATAPPVRLPRDRFDYLVTFDVSQSMNVTDVSLDGRPVSRLQLARAAMREALRQMPCGSRVGWSYFADYRSFTLLLPIEVCSNYDVLLSALDRIDGRMRWANASNISKGVYWALRYAATVPGTVPDKVPDTVPGTVSAVAPVAAPAPGMPTGADIVFITDGQEAPPLPPGQPPMPGLESPLPGGWLIGVGGDTPSPIPKTDDNGADNGYWTAESVAQDPSLPPGTSHEHLSELREDYLRRLASQLGLGYQRLGSQTALTRALLDGRCAHRAWTPTDIRWLPALLALVLLVWRHAPVAMRTTLPIRR